MTSVTLRGLQVLAQRCVRKTIARFLSLSAGLTLTWFFAALPATAQPATPPANFPNVQLPSAANGEAAIRALGNRLPAVAAFYGYSVAEFAKMLRTDSTLWIDRRGRAFYIEPEAAGPGEAPDDVLEPLEYPLSETFFLNSRPGAQRTIYLDFDGAAISGTAWNASYGVNVINAPAYDTGGDPSIFTDAELRDIQRMWRLAAEDFAPFDVNVTTQDPGVDAITRSGTGDLAFGTRVVITRDNFASCGCGGFAYLRAFDDTNDYYKPAFVFNRGVKGGGEAITHEVGHNLSLNHDGVTNGTAYYSGHGSGSTGWAPIMGVGYNRNLVQWSSGEYSAANNLEDDLARIPQYGIPFRADDHGDSTSSASNFVVSSDGVTATLNADGVISTREDIDAFRFFAGAGSYSFTVTPAPQAPNLDVFVALTDASGALLAFDNPAEGLGAGLTGTLAAGEYFVTVTGTGKGDPLGTGYTDYASLGHYRISGSVADAAELQPPTAQLDVLSVSGNTPLRVDFDASASVNADRYDWTFGDGNTGTGAVTANTYMAPGSYDVTVTATNTASGLSASATATVAVLNRSPVAAIAPVNDGQEAPVAFTFDGSGSSDEDQLYAPEHRIVTYAWQFGDGATASGPQVEHAYDAGGSYTVTLTVTDVLGASDSTTTTVEVLSPPFVEVSPSSEQTLLGSVTGSLTDTLAEDGREQVLREQESGGKPALRTSQLQHEWSFSLPQGSDALLQLTARQSVSSDGDNMAFYYRFNGGAAQSLPIQLADVASSFLASVPASGGTLVVGVRDSNRDAGSRQLDSIAVDALSVRVSHGTGTGTPPVAPELVAATALGSDAVRLQWTDLSDDELGFRVQRRDGGSADWATVAALAADVVQFDDGGLRADMTYEYRVVSFNASGEAPSSGLAVTTEPSSGIALTATGTKVKGEQTVTLSFSGASSVRVFRDGNEVASAVSGGRYVDEGLGKGGGSYTYQVCTTDLAVCSGSVVVTF